MKHDWQILTEMTQDKEMLVKQVEVVESGILIEGTFELPALAKLTIQDQMFIAAFIGVHGSIKEMERLFRVSYPTIKARLKKIIQALKNFGWITQEIIENKHTILDRLARREITVQEAAEELKQCSP